MKWNLGPGKTLPIVTREEWGAALPKKVECLRHPILRVHLNYTGLEKCDSTDDCMKRIRDMQHYCMVEGNLSDLPYNFIVAGDGCVYEAGGWKTYTGPPTKHMWRVGKSISIAFMGNFIEEDPPYGMISLAMDLIKCGLKEKLIHPVFKLTTLQPLHSPLIFDKSVKTEDTNKERLVF